MPGSSRARKVIRDTVQYLGALPRWPARDGVDVLHCTARLGPLRSSVPLVLTLNDLAVLRRPETFNRWTRSYSRLLLPRLARAATRVIAVSEFTAREAIELLGVDEQHVRVIPHGVEAPFTPQARGPTGSTCSQPGRSSRGRTSAGSPRQHGSPASSCESRVPAAANSSGSLVTTYAVSLVHPLLGTLVEAEALKDQRFLLEDRAKKFHDRIREQQLPGGLVIHRGIDNAGTVRPRAGTEQNVLVHAGVTHEQSLVAFLPCGRDVVAEAVAGGRIHGSLEHGVPLDEASRGVASPCARRCGPGPVAGRSHLPRRAGRSTAHRTC
jgi:hypothetical protein